MKRRSRYIVVAWARATDGASRRAVARAVDARARMPRRFEVFVRACSCVPDDVTEGLSAFGRGRRWSTWAMMFRHLLGRAMCSRGKWCCDPRAVRLDLATSATSGVEAFPPRLGGRGYTIRSASWNRRFALVGPTGEPTASRTELGHLEQDRAFG